MNDRSSTPASAGIPQRYLSPRGGIDVDRLKAEASIVAVASEHTDLKLVGAEQVGLCPLHAEHTPSFHVNENKGLYHCFGCSAGGDTIDLFSRLNQTGFVESCACLAGSEPRSARTVSPEEEAVRRVLARQRAVEEWRRAICIEGTPAEKYLTSRGVGSGIPGSLRYGEVPRFWRDDGREGPRQPAMIAAVQDVDGRVTGIHRTFVDREGRKARFGEPRLALGRVRGGAVRLGPVTSRVMLGSGLEDGLALRAMFPGATVWVAPGDANLPQVRLPRGICHVTVCGDADQSGRAAVAATRAALGRKGIATDELYAGRLQGLQRGVAAAPRLSRARPNAIMIKEAMNATTNPGRGGRPGFARAPPRSPAHRPSLSQLPARRRPARTRTPP